MTDMLAKAYIKVKIRDFMTKILEVEIKTTKVCDSEAAFDKYDRDLLDTIAAEDAGRSRAEIRRLRRNEFVSFKAYYETMGRDDVTPDDARYRINSDRKANRLLLLQGYTPRPRA